MATRLGWRAAGRWAARGREARAASWEDVEGARQAGPARWRRGRLAGSIRSGAVSCSRIRPALVDDALDAAGHAAQPRRRLAVRHGRARLVSAWCVEQHQAAGVVATRAAPSPGGASSVGVDRRPPKLACSTPWRDSWCWPPRVSGASIRPACPRSAPSCRRRSRALPRRCAAADHSIRPACSVVSVPRARSPCSTTGRAAGPGRRRWGVVGDHERALEAAGLSPPSCTNQPPGSGRRPVTTPSTVTCWSSRAARPCPGRRRSRARRPARGAGDRAGSQPATRQAASSRAKRTRGTACMQAAGRAGPTRRRCPEAAARAGRPAYFRLSSIQSTVAITCSSVSAGLPPLAGITRNCQKPSIEWR